MKKFASLSDKLQFNSPVVLGFFLLSLLALALGFLTGDWTTRTFFSVYNSSMLSPATYLRFFGHVLGHANVTHFVGNMMLLLVVGPPMEEKYGSRTLLVCILATALVTGVAQFAFFPHTALLGASGVVFMLIILSSFSGAKDGKIPLTLILVALLFLGQEVYSILFVQDTVANFMHLLGGLCGIAFGLALGKRK